MSTVDQPGGSSAHHPHVEREGEYPDKDVSDQTPAESVGEYADTDVEEPRAGQPHDEGSFADHDVEAHERHPAAEGSYIDAEIGDEDVEAVQEARAAEHDHTIANGTHDHGGQTAD